MTHYQQQTGFENIVGKEEIARDKQFLLFPQCFLLNRITVPHFVHIFDIILLFSAELEEPKIGIRGKGLTWFIFYKASIQYTLINTHVHLPNFTLFRKQHLKNDLPYQKSETK